jgi:CheY-like chemotaxis protein
MKDEQGTIEIKLLTKKLNTQETLSLDLSEGEYAQIKIIDDGIGIKEELMQRIFEPFFTTKEPGKGTGLGLSMAHGIIKNHHGGIKVESKIEQGSTFYITLPIVTNPNPVKQKKQISQRKSTGAGKILVVDDEPQILDIIKTALTDFGYQPYTFSDPIKAYTAFRSSPHSFSAIITDEAMPSMRGGELIKKVRAINHDIPIFLCTGYIDSDNRKNKEMVYYLQKPFSLSELSKLLAENVTSVKQAETLA